MKLHDILSASTRPAWTARLVLYLSIVVTLSIAVQVIHWWLG